MDWLLSAVTSTVVLGLIGIIFRDSILKILLKGVEHRYDKKLSGFQSDIRQNEEKIAAVSSLAFSGHLSRQNILEEKKIEAVENIWKSVLTFASLKNSAAMTKSIKLDLAEEMIVEGRGKSTITEFMEILKMEGGLEDKKYALCYSERLYISPMAWALYSAFTSVLIQIQLRLLIIQKAPGYTKLLDSEKVLNLTRLALPHQSKFIDEHGVEGLSYLIDEMEEKLFTELKKILGGYETNKENIQAANAILLAADSLRETTNS